MQSKKRVRFFYSWHSFFWNYLTIAKRKTRKKLSVDDLIIQFPTKHPCEQVIQWQEQMEIDYIVGVWFTVIWTLIKENWNYIIDSK